MGHQCIAAAFGARIVKANTVMHGKTSRIHHYNSGIFSDLPNPLTATRYNSLLVDKANLPECLEITAWTDSDEIMAIKHKTLPIEGIQFHPESILTQAGHSLLANFLKPLYTP